MAVRSILILGASYGSLLASKIMLAGHNVTLVCLPAEANLINAEGFRVRMPVRGRKDMIEIDSRKLPGKIKAGQPSDFDPRRFDLIGLAMQEPQYRSAGVRELLDAVAKIESALHVHHEHAAAAVHQTNPRTGLCSVDRGLHRRRRLGQF